MTVSEPTVHDVTMIRDLVIAATEPDYEIDSAIENLTGTVTNRYGVPEFTRSIDAAIAFITGRLPKFWWEIAFGTKVANGEGPYWAKVYAMESDIGWPGVEEVYDGEAKLFPGATPALALMHGALSALIEIKELEA